jgi:flagellar motility protein MotE (MotC chaperone)
MREALGHVEERCAEGRDEAHSRLSELEHDLAYVRRTLGAEIERVEACTLAALAKQSQDRKAGDAATAEQSMERLRKLETALADLEDRQADALEALRESIARLVSENDRRLVAIEGAAEPRDFAARLAEFRLQIHARILEVEQRSVRALEQLSQTVSVIEGRVASSESAVDAARSA